MAKLQVADCGVIHKVEKEPRTRSNATELSPQAMVDIIIIIIMR